MVRWHLSSSIYNMNFGSKEVRTLVWSCLKWRCLDERDSRSSLFGVSIAIRTTKATDTVLKDFCLSAIDFYLTQDPSPSDHLLHNCHLFSPKCYRLWGKNAWSSAVVARQGPLLKIWAKPKGCPASIFWAVFCDQQCPELNFDAGSPKAHTPNDSSNTFFPDLSDDILSI